MELEKTKDRENRERKKRVRQGVKKVKDQNEAWLESFYKENGNIVL